MTSGWPGAKLGKVESSRQILDTQTSVRRAQSKSPFPLPPRPRARGMCYTPPMLGALAFLGRHAGAVLAGGILIGIVAPPLAAVAAPLLIPSIVLLLVVALVRLEGRQIVALVRRPAAAAAIVLWGLLATPVLMTGAVALVDPAPKLGTAMVLSAACPPIMSAIAFCFMVGLDAALATVVVFTA